MEMMVILLFGDVKFQTQWLEESFGRGHHFFIHSWALSVFDGRFAQLISDPTVRS